MNYTFDPMMSRTKLITLSAPRGCKLVEFFCFWLDAPAGCVEFLELSEYSDNFRAGSELSGALHQIPQYSNTFEQICA